MTKLHKLFVVLMTMPLVVAVALFMVAHPVSAKSASAVQAASCARGLLVAHMNAANPPSVMGSMGMGEAQIRIDVAAGTLTGKWLVGNLRGPIFASHIHRAPAGVAGPVVVPFSGMPAMGGIYTTMNTVTMALLQEIVDNPSAFYANLHTPFAPAGEIRGQLQCLR
jgi:hypothetical protein